ncbi:5E5 antigen-like [Pseudopipra pipra]|uniref:5E5 antigen-like n=1 Tax=Pseudopipra pipra TaxID=415032 RepID=UPI0031388690
MNIRCPAYTITGKYSVSTKSRGGRREEGGNKARDYLLCARGKSCKPGHPLPASSALFPEYFGKYEATLIRSLSPGEGGDGGRRENTDGYRRGKGSRGAIIRSRLSFPDGISAAGTCPPAALLPHRRAGHGVTLTLLGREAGDGGRRRRPWRSAADAWRRRRRPECGSRRARSLPRRRRSPVGLGLGGGGASPAQGGVGGGFRRGRLRSVPCTPRCLRCRCLFTFPEKGPARRGGVGGGAAEHSRAESSRGGAAGAERGGSAGQGGERGFRRRRWRGGRRASGGSRWASGSRSYCGSQRAPAMALARTHSLAHNRARCCHRPPTADRPRPPTGAAAGTRRLSGARSRLGRRDRRERAAPSPGSGAAPPLPQPRGSVASRGSLASFARGSGGVPSAER